MKTFKNFIKEEIHPSILTSKGIINIDDDEVREGLNGLLSIATNCKFITPYVALEKVSKVLSNYHIFLARRPFLKGNSGAATWPVNQFGIKLGWNSDGEFVRDGEVAKDTSKGPPHEGEESEATFAKKPAEQDAEYTVFFEYRMGDCGMFDVFCEVVNKEELQEIVDDLEAEMDESSVDGNLEELREMDLSKFGVERISSGSDDFTSKNVDDRRTKSANEPKGMSALDMDKGEKSSKRNEMSLAKDDDTPRAKLEKPDLKNQEAEPLKPLDNFTQRRMTTPLKSEREAPGPTDRRTDRVMARRQARGVENNWTRPVPGETPHISASVNEEKMSETNHGNKEKKKKVLKDLFGSVRKARDKMKDKVNRDFDPRNLKQVAEASENKETNAAIGALRTQGGQSDSGVKGGPINRMAANMTRTQLLNLIKRNKIKDRMTKKKKEEDKED